MFIYTKFLQFLKIKEIEKHRREWVFNLLNNDTYPFCDFNEKSASAQMIEKDEEGKEYLEEVTHEEYWIHDFYEIIKELVPVIDQSKYDKGFSHIQVNDDLTRLIDKLKYKAKLMQDNLPFEFKKGIQRLNSFISELEREKTNKEHSEDKIAKLVDSLDELFENETQAKECYDVLRKVELIDENNHFNGKNKAAFCVWINELKLSKLNFNGSCSYKVYCLLLSKKFKNLEISNSLFYKPNPRATKEYSLDFKAYFSKLSQHSQSRK